jgi:hypothetical protein
MNQDIWSELLLKELLVLRCDLFNIKNFTGGLNVKLNELIYSDLIDKIGNEEIYGK